MAHQQPLVRDASPATAVYMDNHATTRLDPRVLQVMLPFFIETFGNPASTSHQFGWAARDAVAAARVDRPRHRRESKNRIHQWGHGK